MNTKEKSREDSPQNDFVDLANCRNPEQKEVYLKIYDENYDPFGNKESIIALGNTILDETEHWWIIENQFYTDDRQNHIVGISKKFARFPDELSKESLLEAIEIFGKIRNKLNINGGAFCIRFGNTRLSGASVKRLHFHIVEPKPGSTVSFWMGCKNS